MTKPLDPEIKALRALERAMRSVPAPARQRCLEWLVANQCGVASVRLPRVAGKGQT